MSSETPPAPHHQPPLVKDELALVLTGGGARGAYQAGVIRGLARRFPELRLPILTGVSAGAVNAAFLAQHAGPFGNAADQLSQLWTRLGVDAVFRVDSASLASSVGRWGTRLLSGGRLGEGRTRGLVDTGPLEQTLRHGFDSTDGTLPGIARNLERGALRALALSTTSYTTGQSVIWVQGREIELWERPKRRAVQAPLCVDHVMASAALPLFFPAVPIGNEWYGDGGIRLTAPLSPALHLGASRLLTVSTRYERTSSEAGRREVPGYPPPAQVLGVLYSAIFLDLIDQDVIRLRRMNEILEKLPVEKRNGLRVVDIMVIRPSKDLGMIARDFEPGLPRSFRFLTRGLGTREARSADVLSLLMFQEDYVQRLVELGEADVDSRGEQLEKFLTAESRG